MTTPDDLARRLALADHIQGLWYPTHAGAWLKAVPTRDVLDPPLRRAFAAVGDDPDRRLAAHRDALAELLAHHFYNWTPEDSPYDTFNTRAWRPQTRPEAQAQADEILAAAAARIQEVLADEAAERAEAADGGWLEHLGPSRLADLAIDLPALRRWFTADLWGAAEPTWWTNAAPRVHTPAVVGVDPDLIAILWLP